MAVQKGARWGTTSSGYRYERIDAASLVPADGADSFSWSCGEPGCGAHIQGGRAMLDEHYRVVHPERLEDDGELDRVPYGS